MEASFASDEDVRAAPGHVNNVGWWFKKWFYTHRRDIMAGGEPTHEFIPTYQYIFRHNRCIFDSPRPASGAYWKQRPVPHVLGWLNPPKVTFPSCRLPQRFERR